MSDLEKPGSPSSPDVAKSTGGKSPDSKPRREKKRRPEVSNSSLADAEDRYVQPKDKPHDIDEYYSSKKTVAVPGGGETTIPKKSETAPVLKIDPDLKIGGLALADFVANIEQEAKDKKIPYEPISKGVLLDADTHDADVIKKAAAKPSFEKKLGAIDENTEIPHTPGNPVSNVIWRYAARVFNKPIITLQERLYQRANAKSLKVAAKYTELNARVNEKMRTLASIPAITKELSDLMNPKLLAQKERDQIKLTIELEALQRSRDIAALQLEKVNDTKTRYESAQKRLVDRMSEKIHERSAPYKEKVETLLEERNAFSKQIDDLAQKNQDAQRTIDEIKVRIETSSFKFEKDALKKKIKILEAETGKNSKIIRGLESSRDQKDVRLSKAEQRLGKWGVLQNEFNRVTERKRSDYYRPTGENNTLEPSSERGYSFDTRKGPINLEDKPSGDQELFNKVEISPKEYLLQWNKMFPKNPISIDMFPTVIGIYEKDKKVDVDKKVAGLTVESQIWTYFKLKAQVSAKPINENELLIQLEQIRKSYIS